jgi:hypothetical protein
MEWHVVTWCSYKLSQKPVISSKVTATVSEMVYSSLSEWLHAFRNTNSFFRVRPKYSQAHLSEWCAESWSTSVCCLALWVANHLVTVKSTPTTLLLPLAFFCHEWSYDTISCVKSIWTDRLPVWVLKAIGSFPPFYLPGRWAVFTVVLHYSSSVLDWEYAYHKGIHRKLVKRYTPIKDLVHTLNCSFGFISFQNCRATWYGVTSSEN